VSEQGRAELVAQIRSAHVALDTLGAPRFHAHGTDPLQLHERILHYRDGARERRQRFRERVDQKLDAIQTALGNLQPRNVRTKT
jgi:hypothetical protein